MKGIDIVLIAKCLSAFFAVAAALTGFRASNLWYRSSKVVIDPNWEIEPVVQHLAQMGWITAILSALSDAADLNAKAAKWTAVSVALAAIATIIGLLAG